MCYVYMFGRVGAPQAVEWVARYCYACRETSKENEGREKVYIYLYGESVCPNER